MRYDFREKETGFRRPVWMFVDRMMTKPKCLRKVLYLDTALACETIHLLGLGYNADNLYPVNRSAAQLARMTQVLDAKGLPRVRTSGQAIEFVEACRRQRFDVVSFDGCGTMTSKEFTGDGDQRIVNALLEAAPRVLILTIQCGRETADRFSEIEKDSERYYEGGRVIDSTGKSSSVLTMERIEKAIDLATYGTRRRTRAAVDRRGCLFHVHKFKWSSYVSSSRNRMAWCVASVSRHVDDPITNGAFVVRKRVRSFLNGGIVPACAVMRSDDATKRDWKIVDSWGHRH